jgi:uncharacterized membrane protein
MNYKNNKNLNSTCIRKERERGGGFMLKQTTSQKITTRQMTKAGVLSAITIVLGVTRMGFIPLGAINATIMHVPVIIGAILEGPVVGMLIGLIFGIFSMIQAVTAPTVLSFAFINPLVAVLPRILIALISYYLYNLLKKVIKNDKVAVPVAAALGSMTNTIGVLGMIYLLYVEQFAKVLSVNVNGVLAFIFTTATTNGVIEAIVAAIITSAVVVAIRKIEKR